MRSSHCLALPAVILVGVLSACATGRLTPVEFVTQSVPGHVSGPYSYIEDSADIHRDGINPWFNKKTDFFYVEKLGDTKIGNSRSSTLTANRGQGNYFLKTIMVRHKVPAKRITVTISGRTTYAAPIWEYANTIHEVSGAIDFQPTAGEVYVVKGVLGDAYSAVWIEEKRTGSFVGNKIEARASVPRN